MKYSSQCKQDEFVHKILGLKNSGYFIDIGAGRPITDSNSYALESFGWKGLCFDISEQENFSSVRKSKLIVGDATTHDYKNIFLRENVPPTVDYLSLDVDESTLKALERIPFENYEFAVLTVEHDFYRFGNALRTRERDILNSLKYYLLCSDVDGLCDEKTFFEDWWINPEFVDIEKFEYLVCHRKCFRDIISNF